MKWASLFWWQQKGLCEVVLLVFFVGRRRKGHLGCGEVGGGCKYIYLGDVDWKEYVWHWESWGYLPWRMWAFVQCVRQSPSSTQSAVASSRRSDSRLLDSAVYGAVAAVVVVDVVAAAAAGAPPRQ